MAVVANAIFHYFDAPIWMALIA